MAGTPERIHVLVGQKMVLKRWKEGKEVKS